MAAVSPRNFLRQKVVSLHIDFKEKNPIAKWTLPKLIVKNKRTEETSSCECIWWAECVNVAAETIDHQIKGNNSVYGRSAISIRQPLKQICQADEIREWEAQINYTAFRKRQESTQI